MNSPSPHSHVALLPGQLFCGGGTELWSMFGQDFSVTPGQPRAGAIFSWIYFHGAAGSEIEPESAYSTLMSTVINY